MKYFYGLYMSSMRLNAEGIKQCTITECFPRLTLVGFTTVTNNLRIFKKKYFFLWRFCGTFAKTSG